MQLFYRSHNAINHISSGAMRQENVPINCSIFDLVYLFTLNWYEMEFLGLYKKKETLTKFKINLKILVILFFTFIIYFDFIKNFN